VKRASCTSTTFSWPCAAAWMSAVLPRLSVSFGSAFFSSSIETDAQRDCESARGQVALHTRGLVELHACAHMQVCACVRIQSPHPSYLHPFGHDTQLAADRSTPRASSRAPSSSAPAHRKKLRACSPPPPALCCLVGSPHLSCRQSQVLRRV